MKPLIKEQDFPLHCFDSDILEIASDLAERNAESKNIELYEEDPDANDGSILMTDEGHDFFDNLNEEYLEAIRGLVKQYLQVIQPHKTGKNQIEQMSRSVDKLLALVRQEVL